MRKCRFNLKYTTYPSPRQHIYHQVVDTEVLQYRMCSD